MSFFDRFRKAKNPAAEEQHLENQPAHVLLKSIVNGTLPLNRAVEHFRNSNIQADELLEAVKHQVASVSDNLDVKTFLRDLFEHDQQFAARVPRLPSVESKPRIYEGARSVAALENNLKELSAAEVESIFNLLCDDPEPLLVEGSYDKAVCRVSEEHSALIEPYDRNQWAADHSVVTDVILKSQKKLQGKGFDNFFHAGIHSTKPSMPTDEQSLAHRLGKMVNTKAKRDQRGSLQLLKMKLAQDLGSDVFSKGSNGDPVCNMEIGDISIPLDKSTTKLSLDSTHGLVQQETVETRSMRFVSVTFQVDKYASNDTRPGYVRVVFLLGYSHRVDADLYGQSSDGRGAFELYMQALRSDPGFFAKAAYRLVPEAFSSQDGKYSYWSPTPGQTTPIHIDMNDEILASLKIEDGRPFKGSHQFSGQL